MIAKIYKNKGEFEKAGKYYLHLLPHLNNKNVVLNAQLVKTASDVFSRSRKTANLGKKLIDLFLEAKRPIQVIDGASDYRYHEKTDSCTPYSPELHQSIAQYIPSSHEFIPSYHHKELRASKYSKILYVHIPKCGGYTFERPISLLLQDIATINRKMHLALHPGSYILSHTIKTKDHMIALLDKLKTLEANNIRSSFIHLHSTIDYNFMPDLLKIHSNNIKIVSTVRDPRERLQSAVRMAAREADSIDDLKKIIKRVPESFDNAIYNYLSQPSLKGQSLEDPYSSIINISDYLKINKLKSDFLTASGLPNILQPRVLNSAPLREKDYQSTISKEEIIETSSKLIASGHIEKDVDFLCKLALNRSNNSKKANPLNNFIHPYTVVFSEGAKSLKVVKTENIFSGHWLHED